MTTVLQGIRVLDLSRVFAGPAATQILGDLGADVIKVEEPGRGDEARYFGVTKESLAQSDGVSPSFVALNRNKRSIAIDLGAPAGRDTVRRMVAHCDVVVHNFRPGAMTRWGLDYPALSAINPGVIYGDFYAYGRQGSLSHIGANDLALQAHSGLMSITGEPDRPPVRCGSSIVDLHASLALVTAILAALFHRERTGEGQAVETSLLRSSAHLMNYFYGEYWSLGVIRKPMGTANHLSVPNQLFPAADGSVVIIAPSDEMWARCADALDAEKLNRAEWKTILQRQQQRKEVVAAISAVTSTLTSTELVERLGKARVNVAKLNSIGEAADHEQLAAIGGVVEFDMDGKRVKAVASPFALEGTPTVVDRPPPGLAAHTGEVLAELGFSDADVTALRADGAFGVRSNAMNRIDLDGRVAVITGGSGGIGFATAQRMVDSGATVVLWDRDAQSLREAQARLAPARSHVVDVTDEAAVERATADTIAQCARIDILVNAAGITSPKALILETSLDVWRRLFEINMVGTFLCSRAVARHMVAANYGRIVNLGSISGKEGNPFSAAYSASKAAVHSFTKSLAKELAKTGVRVNCVAPAIVATKNLYHDMPEEMQKLWVSRVPMGRPGRPEEVAAMITWLASEECSFTTGAAFDLSGGRATY